MTNPAKSRWFMSGPRPIPTKTEPGWFSDGSGTEPNRFSGPNPDRWRVSRPVANTNNDKYDKPNAL